MNYKVFRNYPAHSIFPTGFSLLIRQTKMVYSILVFLPFFMGCNPGLTVKSPDHANLIALSLDEKGSLNYSVRSHGITAVEKSPMGIGISDPAFDFNSGLRLIRSTDDEIDETYFLPTGKTSTYVNKANQSVFTFENRNRKQMQLVCYASNDGVAFRYVIESPDSLIIKTDNTRFSIPEGTMSWMMDYVPHYENFFTCRVLDTLGMKDLSYPALLHIGQKLWMLLTEACVYDQPATHLAKSGAGSGLSVQLPEAQYTITGKWESPWRTMILGTDLSTIVESVMVENLNPPSSVTDLSWINPGVAVFPWWGNYMANSYIDTLKMYVDLAAEMNWEWIEFDVSLVGSPFRTSDIWETTGWLPEFTTYARSKGISIYGWDEINKLNTIEGRDHIYGRYTELGIKGIKIDYINSDRQYAMCFRRDALHDALQKKMMVSFHGETIPRGQRRTFPNLMTLEGVRGAEYYTFRNAKAPTPGHNCTLPFTRNVVGPMDYTPVTFTIRPENPRTTTYAHELALAVIFESGWLVMADRPDAYLNSPAKEILKKMETAWDETRFIEGFPGEYVCMARRKGDSWFIAGINNENEKFLKIPLDFAGKGNYSVTVYSDKAGQELTGIEINRDTISQGGFLPVRMMPHGGFCSLLEKI